jgi:5-methyltetrahydrofolate--homocysteine methyltransferase
MVYFKSQSGYTRSSNKYSTFFDSCKGLFPFFSYFLKEERALNRIFINGCYNEKKALVKRGIVMIDLKALCEKRMILFDGGTGSVLVEKGLQAGEKPENWNLLHPEVIEALHLSYIEAGADIIKSNTFGAYTHKFGDKTEEIITAAMQNARNAVKKGGKDTLVALDIGPTGRLIEPLGDLAFEEAVSIFANTIRIGAPFADLVLIETMADLHEIKAAVIAAKENTSLPIVATVALDDHGRLMTGADIDAIVSLLEGLGVSALGVNCGFGPEKLLPFAEQLKKAIVEHKQNR